MDQEKVENNANSFSPTSSTSTETLTETLNDLSVQEQQNSTTQQQSTTPASDSQNGSADF